MLLRSSSTPVLGSLLSSLSDNQNTFDNNGRQSSCSDNLKRLSFSHGGHSNFHGFSCNSSPASQTFELDQETGGLRGFRRVQSDGNLEGLAGAIDPDDLHEFNRTMRTRRPNSKLEPIPSFSVFNSRCYNEEEEEDEGEDQEEFVYDGLERSMTIGSVGDFTFDNQEISNFGDQVTMMETNTMKEENLSEFEVGVESAPLFLAKGLGIDVGDPANDMEGGGDGISFLAPDSGGDCGGGDGSNMEEYYQRMLEENPSNSMILRNYAQFLYQTKGDYQSAEEYYSRAILMEPGDGEVLSQYAKLIWELHHDHGRALSYFEQAVQAAPKDSHVLAAYASFLWETEGDDEEEEGGEEGFGSKDSIGMPIFHGVLASASA